MQAMARASSLAVRARHAQPALTGGKDFPSIEKRVRHKLDPKSLERNYQPGFVGLVVRIGRR